jgi:hypothetical protein
LASKNIELPVAFGMINPGISPLQAQKQSLSAMAQRLAESLRQIYSRYYVSYDGL